SLIPQHSDEESMSCGAVTGEKTRNWVGWKVSLSLARVGRRKRLPHQGRLRERLRLVDEDFSQGAPDGTAGGFDFQHGGQGGSDIVDGHGRMVEARTNARSEENQRHVGVVAVGRRVSGTVAGADYPIGVRDELDVRAAPQMVAVGHLLAEGIAQSPASLD